MTTNKQLRELAERATPGPWGWDGPVWGYDTENEAPWLIQERGSDVVITGEIQCSEANAEYIATASPEVITALLDENEALQAECEKLRKDAERYRFLCDGNGYFLEHEMLCGFENEKAEADAAIDAAIQEDNPCQT